MKDWFETWFNSHYYHILYKDRDYEEAARFIKNLVQYINLESGSRVLDLACGKGRHSLEFRKHGFDVTGVDLAEESIEEAKQYETNGLEFFVHDMRSLYWAEHFDLVVNLFTSFGYFHNVEDDQKTISSISDALKPNGTCIIDFMNATKVVQNLVASEQKVIEGVAFNLQRSFEDGIIKKRIQVQDGETELGFEEQVDALTLGDFKQYFEKAGLKIQDVFGNYDFENFDVDHSDRLILVAKKVTS